MIHKTKGIVLRSVKYGENSLIVTLLTEVFGIQTYIINGARSQKKGSSKAMMMQPSAILELEVYHNELKNIQRIKECNWGVIYSNILTDVTKNSIALYMMELLHKTLKQPEPNAELFYFCEDVLTQLDIANSKVAANISLFFSLQLAQFFGFKIQQPDSKLITENDFYIDLIEGKFTPSQPAHVNFISGAAAMLTAELLNVMHPTELDEIKLNKQMRRELLTRYQQYYSLHFADFGQMKTLAVLQEVLG